MKKLDSSSVTFFLNHEVSMGLKKIEMEFRRKGYKNMSRTFLLNSIGNNMVELFNQKGISEIEKIISKDWEKWQE